MKLIKTVVLWLTDLIKSLRSYWIHSTTGLVLLVRYGPFVTQTQEANFHMTVYDIIPTGKECLKPNNISSFSKEIVSPIFMIYCIYLWRSYFRLKQLHFSLTSCSKITILLCCLVFLSIDVQLKYIIISLNSILMRQEGSNARFIIK